MQPQAGCLCFTVSKLPRLYYLVRLSDMAANYAYRVFKCYFFNWRIQEQPNKIQGFRLLHFLIFEPATHHLPPSVCMVGAQSSYPSHRQEFPEHHIVSGCQVFPFLKCRSSRHRVLIWKMPLELSRYIHKLLVFSFLTTYEFTSNQIVCSNVCTFLFRKPHRVYPCPHSCTSNSNH